MRASEAAPDAGPAGRFARGYPVLLVLAGAGVYASSIDAPFVFDDSLIGTSGYASLRSSRPFFALTLLADLALHGHTAPGFHLVNVAIHVLAGLALYGVVRWTAARSLGARPGDALPAGLGFAVALLWLVHPLQTESVAYVWQRSESLMGLFALASLYCLIRCAAGGRALAWGAGAVAALALSIASKEVGVVLPALLLLHDRTFLSGSFRAALRARGVLHAALALAAAALFVALVYAQHFSSEAKSHGVTGASPWLYALSQAEVLVHYLGLSVWPHPLCLDYGWPEATGLGDVLPQLAAVLALLGATAWGILRRSWLGFAGAWFFAILAPTSSVFPLPDLAVEHRMYLPLAAVLAVLVVGGRELLARLFPRARRLAPVLLVAWALALGARTVHRNEDYRSAVRLWQVTAECAPRAARPRVNLGSVLIEQGRAREALDVLAEAVRLEPQNGLAHMNLGSARLALGDVDGGLAALTRAESLFDDPRCHDLLGYALFLKGDHAGAARAFELALAGAPEDASILYRSAANLERLGRGDEALARYRRALELAPDFQEAHVNLALALALRGEFEESLAHSLRAAEIAPDTFEEFFNLGQTLRNLGRMDEAIAAFDQASRAAPERPEPHAALAETVCMKPDASRAEREEALRRARRANELSRPARPEFVAIQGMAEQALRDAGAR